MHPLQRKIAELRQQVRRIVASYGLSWVLGSVVAVILVLALADYLIHFQDRGIRLMASLAVAATLLWTAWRFLLQPLRYRLRDVDIAQRVERRFPALSDRLSSAVEFLKQSEHDQEAGSVALRRAVIASTSAEVEQLDLGQVLQRRPARLAMFSAGVILLIALLFVAADPASARLSLTRLARPMGEDSWPKINQLAFRNPPEKVALGKTFEVELVDASGNRLPDEVRIFYKYDGDTAQPEEVEAMQLLGSVMVARKDNVQRPFMYRAEGGDDRSMQWHRLDVVEPPKIESLKITLTPPAYTGWPVEAAQRHIHALRGTRVQMNGQVTKQLSAAKYQDEHGNSVAARLSDDGYSLQAPGDESTQLVIDKSGLYWLELTDRQGLVGGADSRWEIRAIADQAPSVSVEQPAAAIFVTADAVVPLRINAKDDLAIHQIGLKYSRSDKSDVGDIAESLYKGPDQVAPVKAGGLSPQGQMGDARIVEHQWDLKPLGLKPGAQVTFFATATDYSPQQGQSPPRRLTIITPQELEDRLAQRQSLILAEIARALKMQQDARSQTTSLEIQMREVGRLNKQDVDHAQGAELNQRQVTRTLTSESEGIPAQVNDLLTDLASNKVDSPDIQRRMTSILGEIDQLGKQHLNAIERELTGAIKGAQAQLPAAGEKKPPAPTSADSQVKDALTAAGQHQDAVIKSLETMLGELSQWDNYRRFARDIGQVQREQENLAERVRQIGGETRGKDVKELNAQQQADLKKLGAQQQDLARRFERVQQQMDDMQRTLQDSDPLAAATIADALDQSRKQAVSGQMRQSGNQIEKNQTGLVDQSHKEISQNLQDLLDILSNRRENELSRLVKKLREAEKELSELQRKQLGLKKKMDEANKLQNPEERKRELERLAREQRELQQEAQRMSRKLERLQADRAGRSLAGASSKMGQSGAAGEKGDGGDAGEKAQQAGKDLEDAQQQLAERRKQAEADLAREQLAKIEDAMKGLVLREQKVLDETQQSHAKRDSGGKLTPGQQASVINIGHDQKLVQSETLALAEKISSAEVFKLALEGAAQDMGRAAARLARSDTGLATQQAEQSALARCRLLIEAMKPGEKKGKQGDEQGGGQGGGQQQGGQDGIRTIAELKLLKLLQEDLNLRFQQLTAPEQPEPQEDPATRVAELTEEQLRLADLAFKLSQPADDKPEDDPEKLPDLPLDDKLTPGKEPAGAKRPQPPGVERLLDDDVPPPVKEKE